MKLCPPKRIQNVLFCGHKSCMLSHKVGRWLLLCKRPSAKDSWSGRRRRASSHQHQHGRPRRRRRALRGAASCLAQGPRTLVASAQAGRTNHAPLLVPRRPSRATASRRFRRSSRAACRSTPWTCAAQRPRRGRAARARARGGEREREGKRGEEGGGGATRTIAPLREYAARARAAGGRAPSPLVAH